MKIPPKISIITICFNSVNTLERTINSIISQDYDNLEYIIVDGGSDDGTINIIKKYENRITKWISEPDEGISDAFNKGIKLATGDIIGIINSDDGLEPNALCELAQVYDPKIDVYVGELKYIDEKLGNSFIVTPPPIEFTYMTDSRIAHPSTFISKSAYDKYGLYDLHCRTAMDYELLLRMKLHGASFKQVFSQLSFFTMGGVTFSKYTKEKLNEHIYIIRKNGASETDVIKYRVKRTVKNVLIRIIGRNRITRIRAKIGKA